MNRVFVSLSVLLLASIACGLPAIAPVAPDPEQPAPIGVVAVQITPQPTTEASTLYTVTSGVNLRQSPGGEIVGQLEQGERLHAVCNSDGWCQVSFGVHKGQYFWIGCTDRPMGRGCEER